MLRAHVAVERNQLFLEIHRQRGHNRRDDDNRHRQTGRERKHHAQHAEDIREAPEDIRKDPRDAGSDAVGVAHHARKRVPRAGHVVIIEAQLLQIDEAGLLHVAPGQHFKPHAGLEIHQQHHDFKQAYANVLDGIAAEPRRRPRQDELINDPALQQRDVKIRDGEQQIAADGQRQPEPMLADAPPEPLPRRKRESRALFFRSAHSASPSPSADCIRAVRANRPPCARSVSGAPCSTMRPSLSTMI